MDIQVRKDRRKGKVSRRRLKRRVQMAMVAGILCASGSLAPATASVYAGDRHAFATKDTTGIRISEREKFLAAAPTIAIVVHQSATADPYEPVVVSIGMSRQHMSLASDWTQSGSESNEYYRLLTDLDASTIYNARASEGKVKMRNGTPGSLDTYGYGVGDNDSLGADALYVRMGDSGAPADNEVMCYWDMTDVGAGRDAGCTVEWGWDLTDSATVTMLAGWDDDYRYITDWRDGTTQIDLGAGFPDSDASPLRGLQYIACLPEGTGKLKARVINSDGDATTVSQTLTVNASGRTVKTIQASGGDYTTVAAAVTASNGQHGWKLEIEDGHTEDISASMNINAQRLWIEAQGSCTLNLTSGSRVFSVREDYFTIKGVTFSTTTLATTEAVELLANSRSAIVDCHLDDSSLTQNYNRFVSVKHFNQNNPLYGLLIQGCSADIYQTYLISGSINRAGISDVLVIGCDLWGDDTIDATKVVSDGESGMRDVVRTFAQTIGYCRIRELEKDCVRWQNMQHGYAYRNRFEGSFRVGASAGPDNKAFNCRIEENLWTRDNSSSGLACVSIKEGVDGLYVVNNIFKVSVAVAVVGGQAAPGTDSTYFAGYQEHNDIVVAHNTGYYSAASTDAFIGSGATTSTYVTNNSFTNNHLLYHAGYTDTGFVANAATMTTNTAEEGSLSASLVPTPEPTNQTTPGGVEYDYKGKSRSSSSWHGAYASSSSLPSTARNKTLRQTPSIGVRVSP